MENDFRAMLEKARGGDREAVEELLNRHLHGLRAFVRLKSGAKVRARESCSDLVQSVCREVLIDLSDLSCSDETGFRQWLYTVALNKIRHKVEYHSAGKRDVDRQVALEPNAVNPAPSSLLDAYRTICTPSRHAEVEEEMVRIEAAIDRLSDEDRELIIQSRLLGRPHKEIAAELGKTEEAVRKSLSRARARLGVILESGSQ